VEEKIQSNSLPVERTGGRWRDPITRLSPIAGAGFFSGVRWRRG